MKKSFLLLTFAFVASLASCGPINSNSQNGADSNDSQSSSQDTSANSENRPYIIDSTKGQITYGIYPQTHVNDPAVIFELNKITTPESNGWYLFQNEYYAKREGKPYSGGVANTFNDGTNIQSRNTYWFKCEPIIWNIVKTYGTYYHLLSSLLLDTHQFDSSSNNYVNSEIRDWLNNDFYNSAFIDGNNCVMAATVDNSASTTDSESNQYVCDNSSDRVFLLSYQDCLLKTQSDRLCMTTDWARANGPQSSKNYCGSYWTRSPDSNQNLGAFIVNSFGELEGCHVANTTICVCPSIYLLT